MATVTETWVDQVGEIAGEVWNLLRKRGPLTIARLVKQIDAPRDQVMQAVGWLAREDKVWIEEQPRSRVISLR